MGVHLLVLPFKMGIYRKRNVHCIGSSLFIARVSAAKQASHTLKLSIVWVSATKQASDTHKHF